MKYLTYSLSALGILALLGAGYLLGGLTDSSAPLGASGVKSCTNAVTALSPGTSTVILAANTARRSAALVNPSSTTIYVRRGSVAATSTGVPLTNTGSAWTWDEDHDPYTGIVHATVEATTTIRTESCQ